MYSLLTLVGYAAVFVFVIMPLLCLLGLFYEEVRH
jgi:hypothetical protein